MSQREADSFISNNEREFILKGLAEECRLDGRRPYDLRKLKFEFSLDDRSATVALGSTRVMAVVTAALEAPYPDRPSEGPLRFNVEFSPMASPAFEPGKPGEDAIQVARLIERGLRQSGAIDQEALCVVAGRKVWSLRVDCHVLDHGGNLLDACFLAALAALMAFRKPEVELCGEGGSEIRVHPPEVREPLPLTIHHLPLAVTFALFQSGDQVLVDPSWREAAAASGSVTVVMNPAREVCCVHKADGIGLTSEQLLRCMRLAGDKVGELVGALKAALERHEVARVQARVRRHHTVAGLPDGTSRSVMILGDPTGGQAAAAASDEPDAAAADPAAAGDAAADDMSDLAEGDYDDDDDDSNEDGEVAAERDAEAGRGAGAGRPEGGSGDTEMAAEEVGPSGQGATSGEGEPNQQRKQKQEHRGAKLSGPLLPAAKGAAGAKRVAAASSGGGGNGVGGGLQQANKRGKGDVGFDELEAIAAVIAGVPLGGPPAGAPEPDLAAAVKRGKRKPSGVGADQ